MKHIRKFTESEEQKLLGDLEFLGVNPETFTIEDIEEAFYSSDFDPVLFKDGTYMDIGPIKDFDFDIDPDSNRREAYVGVTWNGGIKQSGINTSAIIEEIFSHLKRSEGEPNETRYTLEQIEEAIESVRWEDYLEIDSDSVDVDIDASIRGYQVNIEGDVTDDNIEIDFDVDGVWKEIESNLK